MSTYELTLPYTAKLANLYNNFDVPISLESSLDNQFTILVDASNIAEGSYRLKFTVTILFKLSILIIIIGDIDFTGINTYVGI